MESQPSKRASLKDRLLRLLAAGAAASAVVASAAVGLASIEETGDAPAGTPSLQERVESLRQTIGQSVSPGTDRPDERQVAWYNWHNWHNGWGNGGWHNWHNWGNHW